MAPLFISPLTTVVYTTVRERQSLRLGFGQFPHFPFLVSVINHIHFFFLRTWSASSYLFGLQPPRLSKEMLNEISQQLSSSDIPVSSFYFIFPMFLLFLNLTVKIINSRNSSCLCLYPIYLHQINCRNTFFWIYEFDNYVCTPPGVLSAFSHFLVPRVPLMTHSISRTATICPLSSFIFSTSNPKFINI